ncbi:DUF4123 domain-containing protein [Luteimonas lutimaris]|uniref:DUF4123 domain-containing protein n=1 Tax=Luteimonas lutimaris TaxID=698645 RepID=A0ABP7MNW5_9GAMM
MPDFLFLDGAQLETKGGAAEILGDRSCRRIYDPLGEAAARMGPVIAEADTELLDAAVAWEMRPPRSHAVSRVEASVGLSQLALHFWSIRHVQLTEHRQHFLRYVDTRVLENLMRVLTPRQVAQVFGPVKRWEIRGRDGGRIVLEHPGVPSAQGALRLSEGQGRELLRLSRPDQLLADVIEDEPALIEKGDAAQLHVWAQQALRFLEELRMWSPPLQLAVGTAALRTSGAALGDSSFGDVVRTAAERGDMEPLYAWKPAVGAHETPA